MNIHTFIANYQEAFGQHAELPIAFWYSDRMGASTEKVTGCLFKCMKQVRDGKTVSLSNEPITCGGGKFYTGFTEMPELRHTHTHTSGNDFDLIGFGFFM